MDINNDWIEIRRHFNRSFRSSLHVSIASLGPDNIPTATPIGSLFLNRDQTGIYFEKYPYKLARFAHINDTVCVLGVNSDKFFWINSLMKGRFDRCPAIKLYGRLGPLRNASAVEVKKLRKRMSPTRWLKGHHYLWSDMEKVREITFTHAEPIRLGDMTSHL
jgi:hypothetical protein